MSFWKGLFEEDKKPSPMATDSAQEPQAVASNGLPSAYPTSSPTIPSVASLYTPTSQTAQVDSAIVTELTNVALSTKESGYAAFKAIFDALQGIPDSQRYNMALAALKGSQKLTAADVARALQDMVRLVDGQSKDFEAAWNDANTKQVTGIKTQVATIETTIENYKKQIADLENQRVTLTAKAGQAQVSLEQQRASFHVSFDSVRSSFSNELLKIQTLITPSPAKVTN